jgi:ATP-dependent DNA ligase
MRSEQAQLHAFDMLAGDGEDHHRLPLSLREANLDRPLSRQVGGIFMADYEERDIGHLFRAACRMGLEGIVSKHLAAPIVAADGCPGGTASVLLGPPTTPRPGRYA